MRGGQEAKRTLPPPSPQHPHLEADVLSLPVAVQPEHEVVAALGLTLQVPAHVRLHTRARSREGGGVGRREEGAVYSMPCQSAREHSLGKVALHMGRGEKDWHGEALPLAPPSQ